MPELSGLAFTVQRDPAEHGPLATVGMTLAAEAAGAVATIVATANGTIIPTVQDFLFTIFLPSSVRRLFGSFAC